MTSAAAFPRDFWKGHGTQNDFIIVDDPGALLALEPATVAALCDRQRGIGADGLLRVARAGTLVDAGVLNGLGEGIAADDLFMDYRNADGSIAEMCGNGVRVFAHFCRVVGLADTDEFVVGSRAGARPVRIHEFTPTSADVSVQMGPARRGVTSAATIDGHVYRGLAVDVGNPHLACVVAGLSHKELAALDFTGGADFDASVFPEGVNVELVTEPVSDGAVLSASMRVIERGVGETRSCGTGLVAAASAALASRDRESGQLRLTVPGGRVEVEIDGVTGSTLRGPSRLVARGELFDGALA
ncbi:diaminopimelate epimerase [Gordonia araii NBRC 100433]|uniref:Diaminopimelate epimerase n=1 Tax=Gordonia araii NBRC 100433 TaxID=1073574 RepID=G7H0F5_9ACTN|nr:diaminopimelate epimerase [Gordonia araii]NNG96906.1 diaminopimelate epimerase [Gordonia araii NBRC 100433]GAB09330.1 diaminopimelate epimerase [Gordonia araii NBRC 100433]